MIRRANKEDISSINELGSLVNPNFINTYNIQEYINNSNYIILVNEEESINGLLIIYSNIDYYELEIIVVGQKYRKKGIATNMLNYFLDNYEKKDILLEVDTNNNDAIKLYDKVGFIIINTREGYYRGKDAYIMQRVVK